MKIAVFDLLINNADRKGGHIIQDTSKVLWGIDNALSFHEEKKLRTVIWDFAKIKIEKNLINDLVNLRKDYETINQSLLTLLSEKEIQALSDRCDDIINEPILPNLYPWRCWPWPLI